MSKAAMEFLKPEIKSYIWLRTKDGSIQQVEESLIMLSPVVYQDIVDNHKGSSKNCAITLPECVTTKVLNLILHYYRFHQVNGRSNKERITFNKIFFRMEIQTLHELACATVSLELYPLLRLTCNAISREFQRKTTKEIRETFHINDLPEEEKMEHLKHMTSYPHIRLHKKLNARKLQDMKEKKFKDVEVGQDIKEEPSIDNILSFVNGSNQDTRGGNRNKKKNKRGKDKAKDHPKSANQYYNEELECSSDDLDLALKEEIDRLDINVLLLVFKLIRIKLKAGYMII
ncbi:SKP1-like protein 21 [Vicia villosa]|uniref:SKP1-like protein 21 n=1 Tax=Vicia villosa TaxID=3911 RepID=UPI00273CAF96|nr:SKP1-like protein 21 [Vicia villosa]